MFIFDDDYFTHKEYKYCEQIIGEISGVPWVQVLLKKIRDMNYPSNSKELKSTLFELEIAFEFFKTHSELEYEYRTGIGLTDVDFRYNSGKINCLIEAVVINVSEEVKGATIINEIQPGITEFETKLAGDQKASLGHEMIKVQGKILEKACNKEGKSVKFPIPEQDDLHVVAVDIRNFGGDKWDYLQIAYGPRIVPDYCKLTYYRKFIRGIFEEGNDCNQARTFRERVHVIAFCNFKTFDSPLFSEQNCYLCWNPWLFKDTKLLKKSIANVPAFCNYPSVLL